MGTPTDFRRYARDCVELAEQATNARYRAMLLDMAEKWLRLADQTKREEDLLAAEAAAIGENARLSKFRRSEISTKTK